MIEEIFRELYKAPVEFRWALANSGLQKIMTGEAWDVSPFGRRGRLIRRLVGFACTFGAARLVVALTALQRSPALCIRHGGCNRYDYPLNAAFSLASVRALKKKCGVRFEEESDELAIRLDETLPETFLAYHRPSVFELWKQIWRASGAVLPFLLKTELEPVASNRKDTLTYAAA